MAGFTTEMRAEAWWDRDRVEMADAHFAQHHTICIIQEGQAYRRAIDRAFMAMFSDLEYVGHTRSTWHSVDDLLEGRLSENVIKSIVLTIFGKLTKTLPVPAHQAIGGGYALGQQAQKRDQLLRGGWQRVNMDRQTRMAVLHSLILGTGCIEVFEEDGRPCAQVAPPWEWWIDPTEGKYGTMGTHPRNYHRVQAIDRGVVLAMAENGDFGEDAKKRLDDIRDAKPDSRLIDDLDMLSDSGTADMLPLAKSWHLASTDGAEDGRETVGIPGIITLYDAPYTRTRPPAAFYRYNWRPLGFWGAGVVEDLCGGQAELTRAQWFRQRVMMMLAAPYIAIQKGSRVTKGRLAGWIGRVMEYVGSPPQLIVPNPIGDSMFGHEQSVKDGMFGTARTSQLSVMSLKPAGLDSGKALRVFEQIEAEGLSPQMNELNDFRLELAEIWMDVVEDIVTRKRDAGEEKELLTELFEDDRELAEVKFEDIPGLNNFRLQRAPISALSNNPAGLTNDVQDLQSLGVITDPNDVMDLVASKIPDLERYRKDRLAARNMARKLIEVDLLQKNRLDLEVEPTDPHDLLFAIGSTKLLEVRTMDDPPPGVDALRIFLRKVQVAQQDRAQREAEKAAAAQQAVAGGAVPGAPPPPPGADPAAPPSIPPADVGGPAPIGVA